MPSPATAAAISNNPLLVKDSVGKTRPTVYDLPGQSHVYGKKVERNPEECAAQVLQNWNVKAKSKHAIPALDYISMNRNTAKQGIIDPSEIRAFRKKHPIRLKIGEGDVQVNAEITSAEMRKQRLIGPLPHEKDANFVYGKPTRPSTPVAALMTDRYQQEWIREQEKRNTEQAQEHKEKAKKKQTKTVTPAKVSLPKKVALVDKDPSTLFKMSKFQSAGSKISARRTYDDPAIAEILARSAKSRGKPGPTGRNTAPAAGGSSSQTSNAEESVAAAAAAEPAEKTSVRFADNSSK